MRRKLLWLVGLSAAAAAMAGAVMVPQTLDDLTAHATLVVTGTVESVRSETTGSDGMIRSVATVRVGSTIVGVTKDDVVTVRYLGGQLGNRALVVEDQPTFRVGEEVILFLAPANPDGYWCPDAAQSKLTVLEGTVLGDGRSVNDYLAAVAAAASR